MSRGSESGKKFGNIIKSRWIIALRTPGGYCGRQGARGMVRLGRWLSSADSPYSKYEPVVRVREERGWKRDRERGGGGETAPLNAVA